MKGCEEMGKELYEWYKEHRICVRCKQVKAIKGKTKCVECTEFERAKSRQYYAEHRQAIRAIQHSGYKRRRAGYISAGMCPCCGKREPREGYKLCEACQASRRDYMRMVRAQSKEDKV